MLHAELHGKLAADAANHERREDILTSTVFGTLVVAEAVDVLREWLAEARDAADVAAIGAFGPGQGWRVWFWPRLREAEPDVVVRLGRRLFVIEAKYGSGESRRGERGAEENMEVDDDERR